MNKPFHTNYPFEFSHGLEYTRLPAYGGMHPYPSMIGSLRVAHPLHDVVSMSPVSAGVWGGGIGNYTTAVNQQFTQVLSPNLPKTRG